MSSVLRSLCCGPGAAGRSEVETFSLDPRSAMILVWRRRKSPRDVNDYRGSGVYPACEEWVGRQRGVRLLAPSPGRLEER
jgi:hypothetical protein